MHLEALRWAMPEQVWRLLHEASRGNKQCAGRGGVEGRSYVAGSFCWSCSFSRRDVTLELYDTIIILLFETRCVLRLYNSTDDVHFFVSSRRDVTLIIVQYCALFLCSSSSLRGAIRVGSSIECILRRQKGLSVQFPRICYVWKRQAGSGRLEAAGWPKQRRTTEKRLVRSIETAYLWASSMYQRGIHKLRASGSTFCRSGYGCLLIRVLLRAMVSISNNRTTLPPGVQVPLPSTGKKHNVSPWCSCSC